LRHRDTMASWRSSQRIMLPLAFLVVLLAYLLRHSPDGRVHFWLVSPSQPGLLIVTPGGEAVLIGGGSDPVTLGVFLGERMPLLTRHLALVVLPCVDDASLSAQTDVLERYPPRVAWHPPLDRNAAAQAAWLDAAARYGEVAPLRVGLSRRVDGATFTVWGQDPLVLGVVVGALRVIYAPDVSLDVGDVPAYAQGATMWILKGVESDSEAMSPLPPVVILAGLVTSARGSASSDLTLLRAARTSFLIGEEADGFHLATDGRHYRWDRSR